MKILHINIRASQGGAGRVALDLHRRLLGAGIESILLYGYAAGIIDDSSVARDNTIMRMGTRLSVLANYAAHRIIGWDLFSGQKHVLADAIIDCDVVHLHAPHHYFLSWDFFIGLVARWRKPMVITAHDWWFITGRCAIVEQCSGWRRGCGECGSMRYRDLPSLLDVSRFNRRRKIASLNALHGRLEIVCPSSHLANDYRTVYRAIPITVIRNSIDLEFETCLTGVNGLARERRGYLFSAADLGAPGKIDAELVHNLAEDRSIDLLLVGRNNPFNYPHLEVFGEISERGAMVDLLQRARALIFCSRMDNAPLTIIEALTAGCHVLAYESPAAQEILEQVGGRCVGSRSDMREVVRAGLAEALYGGIDSVELARRARKVFMGPTMKDAYLRVYERVLGCSDQPC